MADSTQFEFGSARFLVWDTGTLDWIKGQQPILNAGSITIPGTVTIAGTVTANAGTNLNTSGLLTAAAHAAVTGTTTDAAVLTDATGTTSGKLRGIVTWLSRIIGVRLGTTSEYGVQLSGAAAPAGEVRLVAVTNTSPTVTDAGMVVRNLSGVSAPGGGIPDLITAVGARDSGDTNLYSLVLRAVDPTSTDRGVVVRNLPSGTQAVSVASLPNVTLAAGTNTNEVVGDVAHDAAAVGNPLLVCGISQDWDTTAPLNRVSAEGDATRIATDRDGAVFVRTGGPQYWDYHENSSSALTDAVVEAAPGAGLSLYVTSIVFSKGAASVINVFFEEGASTVLGPFYVASGSGQGFVIHFPTPKKITANTALTITTSAAIAHGIDVIGFVAQG